MTDAETREIWNELLAADESDLTVDDLLRLPAGAVSLLRLLAESQQALREIRAKFKWVLDYPDVFFHPKILEVLKEMQNIAKNARKEE